ncbi:MULTISPECIES: DASH family cryptochrome [unclassified Halomonas]|uniref:DASH family cryptochrome n=1 Tax=unclassified Halomonas TaxID=2609666 RepID=UPI0020A0BDE2|nr:MULTISPECIES: DASH family cryptochrome [unclassified Halomonas]MCP1315080.1 DASH family cryptochrome [Halomonas sp. 707D7]MCP1325465.1 DASH family cryptochrome [Halomonas sp. 707D4]
MNITTDIVWLHDNLRVADNPLLRFDSRPDQLICLYVLDQRLLDASLPGEATPRLGPARLRFLWQSLMALRGELLQLGSDLSVRIGDPSSIVVQLAERYQARSVRVASHSGFEESQRIDCVAEELPSCTTLERLESGYLFDTDELPFKLNDMPASFSAFRQRVEKQWSFKEAVNAPFTLPGWPEDASRGFPPLKAVSEESAFWLPDDRQGFVFMGGEAAAHQRLHHYLWQQNGAESYKKTRNGLLGANFSTRFSPWLAHGCLSARQVYKEVKAWEAVNGANESSQWIVFELLWRDYFHRNAQVEGAALFGDTAMPVPCERFDLWREGKTGVPFIDAAMRELRYTGWISSRSRQNVASFLVNDLEVDWRLGAWWFEHCLIDYDPANNWGNWGHIAGLGRDGRKDRYFNVLKQARHYDPKGLYVAYWLPELDAFDVGIERHQPWRSAPESFDAPCVLPRQWDRWLLDAPESASESVSEPIKVDVPLAHERLPAQEARLGKSVSAPIEETEEAEE